MYLFYLFPNKVTKYIMFMKMDKSRGVHVRKSKYLQDSDRYTKKMLGRQH